MSITSPGGTAKPTPVASTFDWLARLWDALPVGGTLTIRWPTLEVVEPAAARVVTILGVPDPGRTSEGVGFELVHGHARQAAHGDGRGGDAGDEDHGDGD